MSLPSALGATCSKPCPHQAPRHQQGTREDGRGGGLTYNQNWGSKFEPPPPCPHHCSSPPPGMAPQQEQKEGAKGWPGRWNVSGTGGLPVRLRKDGLPRLVETWVLSQGMRFRRASRDLSPWILPEDQVPKGAWKKLGCGQGGNWAVGSEARLWIWGIQGVGKYKKETSMQVD